jgi:hypothetical protein
MSDNLDIHAISMMQADKLIEDIRGNLWDRERDAFIGELDKADEEYLNEIKKLKEQIIKL